MPANDLEVTTAKPFKPTTECKPEAAWRFIERCEVPVLGISKDSDGQFSILYAFERRKAPVLDELVIPKNTQLHSLISGNRVAVGDTLKMTMLNDSEFRSINYLNRVIDHLQTERAEQPIRNHIAAKQFISGLRSRPQDIVQTIGTFMLAGYGLTALAGAVALLPLSPLLTPMLLKAAAVGVIVGTIGLGLEALGPALNQTQGSPRNSFHTARILNSRRY